MYKSKWYVANFDVFVKLIYDFCSLIYKLEPECTDPYVQLIPYFCGNAEKCREKQHWKWALERAKKNVQNNFAFIGLLEDEALSIKLLEWTLPTFFTGAGEV